MPRHLLYFFVFSFFVGNFVGCSREVSVDQKFVDLFIELRVVELTYGKDSPTGRLVRQDALKAAGYTREQFLAKANDILDDERQWMPFQKAVTERIDSLLAEPNEAEAPEKAPAPRENKKALLKKMQQGMPAHKGGVH